MSHFLPPDLVPLWGFYLEKLQLLLSGSSSLGLTTPCIEASLCAQVFLPVSWKEAVLPLSPLVPNAELSFRSVGDPKNG